MAFNRAHGPGMSYDFKRIRDARQRAEAQRLVLRAARLLILQREQFEKIEDITALLKQLKSEFRIEAIVRETLHVIR